MLVFADTGKFSIKTAFLMNVTRLYFGLGDFVFWYGHQVSVEDNEISIFAHFDTAFVAFKEAAFGNPNCDGTQGLLTR